MKARHLTVVATVVAALALSACGAESSSDVTPPTSSTAATSDESTGTGASTITISRSRFDNVELRVSAGTTVTFVNTDPFDHTVTSRDDSPVQFDSGAFGQDETFEFTFVEPGEYAYFCQIHPTMRAAVIVE
jgi:plastocyanin